MNVLVLGEGSNEVGDSWEKRSLLQVRPEGQLAGLEVLVTRTAQEVYGRQPTIVAFPQTRAKVALIEIIQNPDMLTDVLVAAFYAADPALQANRPSGAVVACDEDKAARVKAAVDVARDRIPDRIVAHVVCKPEFEQLLMEPTAMQRGAPTMRPVVIAPNLVRASGVKRAFEQTLRDAGYTGRIDAALKARVARELPPEFLRGEGDAIRALREDLRPLFGV